MGWKTFLFSRRPMAPSTRHYLSDKQRNPHNRRAGHVAKCRPELLTPHNGSEGPSNRPDGMEWASWRLTVISSITAAPDFPVARLQEWTRPFLRMTDHLQRPRSSCWRPHQPGQDGGKRTTIVMSVLVNVFSFSLLQVGILGTLLIFIKDN